MTALVILLTVLISTPVAKGDNSAEVWRKIQLLNDDSFRVREAATRIDAIIFQYEPKVSWTQAAQVFTDGIK